MLNSRDRRKCLNLHCTNFSRSIFGEGVEMELANLDVMETTLGAEKCFGACEAEIAKGSKIYAKITTDDRNGKIKLYVGDGEFLEDKVGTKGGIALCKLDPMQELMNFICMNGFEHHVAMNRSLSAEILGEALLKDYSKVKMKSKQ